jgi:NAD(P)-dependent dehydrogenase (short-subunit alcohol dehydrogenase family)
MPVALVTGASRGVGRGCATALADAGYTVFATGRSIDTALLPSAVVRIRCDHTKDDETAAVFTRIAADASGLDVLVNSAWGGYERMMENGAFTWGLPFWEQPAHRWAGMMDAGVRAAFMCSAHAARMMTSTSISTPTAPRGGRGLIVNISHWAAQKRIGNVIYGVSKAATDKLTADTARELEAHGITVVSLYPGMVRTEAVLAAAEWLDLSNSESPEFIGRVIGALARDPRLAERTGSVLVAAAVAEELAVTDIDGRRPRPLTLDAV